MAEKHDEILQSFITPQSRGLPAILPIAQDKPKDVGGSGQVLRIYEASAKLPAWEMVNPVWPIKINQYFSKYHTGIDLDCDYREPIYAVNEGIITMAEWHTGYGKFIAIQHENGWISRYGHNDQIFIKVGQRVKQGEIIGSCGTTGRSTGYHSHIELIYNNEFINPYKYLNF